jgi:Na+/melibiose symporter-like transporter
MTGLTEKPTDLEPDPPKEEWIPLCQRESLPFYHILAITVGTLGPTLLFNILYTLFAPLSEKLKISPLGRTMILLSGGVQGFVVNPLAGAISDSVTFRYGRRRIFMCLGGLGVVIGLLLMCYCVEIGAVLNKSNPLMAQQAVMIGALEFAMICGTCVQTPSRALCSDLIKPAQQVLAASCVVIYSGLGGMFVNLAGGFSLYSSTSLSQESFILVIGILIIFVSLTISVIASPEEPLKEKPAFRNPFSNIINAFKTMPKPAWLVAIPYLLSQLAAYQIGFQMSHFMGKDIFHGDNSIDAPDEMVDKYQEGVSWAMMCNVVNYGIQFVYSFGHTRVCDFFGMKWVYLVLMALLGVIYMLFFWVSNKIAFLFMFVPVGLASVAYLSIPQAVISLAVPTEELGVYIGALACFSTFGQQFSNFVIGMGGNAIWPNSPRTMIAVSCVFAFLASLACLLIVIPTSVKVCNEEDVGDEEATPAEVSQVGGL